MNYKNFTIKGMHGCGFTVTHCGVVWSFGRKSQAMAFIDGLQG